jgi:hypothetical protein
MYHDLRNAKGRFARSAHPSKDALRKRRARKLARAYAKIPVSTPDFESAPKPVARPAAPKARDFASVDGTIPSPKQAQRFATQRFSFAVYYIRPGDVMEDGSVAANGNNPSRRRFGTRDEAEQHAARFVKKNGHLDSYVLQVNDRPTSWVNEATGLTNEVAQ